MFEGIGRFSSVIDQIWVGGVSALISKKRCALRRACNSQVYEQELGFQVRQSREQMAWQLKKSFRTIIQSFPDGNSRLIWTSADGHRRKTDFRIFRYLASDGIGY